MKELINIIVQKTGISQENAQQSVQVTLGFLKAKLPTPLAAQLDSFLGAGTSSGVNPVTFGAKT
jgi:nucleoid DNA-binding protein